MNPTAAIIDALQVIAARFRSSGVPWVVGGSAGLMLRGIELDAPPRDLDIYVDACDSAAAHAALLAYAVDGQIYSESAIYRSILSHYTVNGVAVELVGGFAVRANGSAYLAEVRDVLLPCSFVYTAGGSTVHLAPLAHELWFNVLRDREDRVAAIAAAIAQAPLAHCGALRLIESRNTFAEAAVARVHGRLGDGKGDE